MKSEKPVRIVKVLTGFLLRKGKSAGNREDRALSEILSPTPDGRLF